MIFRKWTWRFLFIMSLLLFVTMSGLIFSNIINHGCHPFNVPSQICYILLIPCTAIFYAQMQEDNNGRKNSKIKNTKRT